MEGVRTSIVIFLIFLTKGIGKEIDSIFDLEQEESAKLPAEHRVFEDIQLRDHEEFGNHKDWPLGNPVMPQIKFIHVKCEKNHMKVNINFDQPFYGMIFSKGHYSDPKCVHLPPGTGHLTANFEIFIGSCGMSSNQYGTHGDYNSGLFIENVIVIQYDPQVQEIWDTARRLRCTWYDYYEKSVTFRPLNVDMLDAVTTNFLGDNIQCWMQIQVGKGPWASEVSGIVKIGQTMTMVLAIKDEENKFDILVRNCIAHDGIRQPIHLVDDIGCIVRPKLMSNFQKIKNIGASASVLAYAYFQAFKFPDSMNVHFQCVIQVCRHECPTPKCVEDHLEYLPEPRDPSGAYSENKPVIKKSAITQIQSFFPEKRPRITVNRNGDQFPAKVNVSGSYTISATGGKPRSSDRVFHREKRQLSQDIRTQRVIQVVAPGDLAFNIKSEDNETIFNVYSIKNDFMPSSICLSTPRFTAGLVVLLMLLVVSTLVIVFLFFRVRQLTSKSSIQKEKIITYDNSEFLTLPQSITLQHITDK